MPFGRFGSFPFRFGSGIPLARTVYESLNRSLGSAYDTSETSNVVAETSAEARLIAACWNANTRASNQYDADRMTDFIPRWESIFALSVIQNATDNERRTRVKSKFAATTTPTHTSIYNFCLAALGSVLVDVEYTPWNEVASGIMWPPTINWDDTGTAVYPVTGYPQGWSSAVSHIVVRVEQPSTLSENQFVTLVGTTLRQLRDMLPDYDTADWVENNEDDTEGFILDDEHNLDSEAFD